MDDRVVWQMSGLITFEKKGDFSKTFRFLNKLLNREYLNILEKYGREGVARLKEYTPKDTGLTSESWDFVITHNKDNTSISFVNSNVNNYVNIAIILQYGHATRNGGWVEGVDYINPALQPIFDKMAKEAWEEVTKL